VTRITDHWIARPETQTVCRALTDAGFQALFVGGCVRNALLGEPVSDIDISTDAIPETVSELAEKAGLKAVPTGIDHGTITVVSGGLPHEVTTFRHDVETDGRRAVVTYTDRVEEDARRRDFTMNALYARPDGSLVDPLGGLPDLQARRVLFIEDAAARIREDYLRILRFFRFHAWYGDPQAGIDPDGLAACAALSEGLDRLSKERVGAELRKLLGAPDPAPAVASMQAAGCLTRILPGSDARALPILVGLEADAGIAPDPIRRLAALGGRDHATLLRLSRPDARRLGLIRDNATTTKGAGELAYRHGAVAAFDILLVRAALFETPLPKGFSAALDAGETAKFPITSADLLPDFTGSALGKRLRELEDRWIGSGFALSRDELLS
jgi:poly(A) polymerase